MTKMLNSDPSHYRGGRDDERPGGGAEQRGGGGAGAGAGGRALGLGLQLGGQRLRRGVRLVAREEQRLMLSQVCRINNMVPSEVVQKHQKLEARQMLHMLKTYDYIQASTDIITSIRR